MLYEVITLLAAGSHEHELHSCGTFERRRSCRSATLHGPLVRDRKLPSVVPTRLVITSYSIHYTKLYELMRKTTRNDPIGVIGGGLGGLAAACTLAARGYPVVLFESNRWLGGKAAVLEAQGYRFDMGPTILTLPRVLSRIFTEAGRKLEDELELVRLDPQWRCFFEDGSTLDLVQDVDGMAQRLRQYAGNADADGYRDFVQLSSRLHGISERYFFWKSVEHIRDTIDLKGSFRASTLKDVLALRMGRTVAGTVRAHVRDGRVAQMVDHFTQYVGSSPS